ncbi:coiled-coil domain-containing protein 30 [Pelodytes ibericus]
MDKVHYQCEEIINKLKEGGLNPDSSAEEHLTFLWDLYQETQTELQTATSTLVELKQQQTEEMKEVENYVAHIRSLTEEREMLTTDFEKENIQLRIELEKRQIQQESQLKEVEEMLVQECLNEIAHSSPSEQVAYLLVERSTLLEKLELLEQKLDSQLENPSDVKRQDELEQIHQTLEEELYQQRESMKRTKETLNKDPLPSLQNPWKKLFGVHRQADRLSAAGSTYDEELDKEKRMRERVERDLDEAARRLQMSHEEIRRLTDELLIKKKEIYELEHLLQKTRQESEILKQELKTAQENDSQELQKAKDFSTRLNREILALRNRVKSLDSDRKKYIEQGEKSDSESIGKAACKENPTFKDNELLHKSCRLALEEKQCLYKVLQHKLHNLQSEHEETVERNEELESILGETQNRTKEQSEYFECEVAGLQMNIKRLESELQKSQERNQETLAMDRGERIEVTKMAELKQEIQVSTVKMKELQAEISNLKRVEQERNTLRAAKERLEEEMRRGDMKVSELTDECRRLQDLISDQKSSNERLITTDQTCQQLQMKIGDLEKQVEVASVRQAEHRKTCETQQKQINEGMSEKQSLWQETLELRQEIQSVRQDMQAKRAENSRLKREMADMHDKMPRPQSCGDGAEEAVPKFVAGDALLHQQYEEIRQLRQDLHRVQNVCISAEKELRYERDKNLGIKKQHISLQQDNTKLSAELNHVKQKLVNVSSTYSSLEAEQEKRQQDVKEMELELLKRSQGSKMQSNWQEKLEHEKSRAQEAEKMVLELQQQLRAFHHQLQLLQTQVVEKKRLEEELRNTRINETKLQAQLQEEQRKRIVSDQTWEDLKQTNTTLKEAETLLAQDISTLHLKLNQQDSFLRSLDHEKNASAKELGHCESSNQKLSADLHHVQQEKEELHKEYEKLIKQLDEYVRKYNEKQLRHKAKLSRAREVHFNEMNQMDNQIKQLEMELTLSRSQAEKNQQWIQKVTDENEHLHKENRNMLRQVSDQEAVERQYHWKLLSAQNRAHILDEENKQLQESLFQLYKQVGSLDRVLKKIQALNLEEISQILPSDCVSLSDPSLHLPKGSFSPLGSFSPPRMLINAQTLCIPQSNTSDIGYLNVSSPGITVKSRERLETPAQPPTQHPEDV